VFRFPQALVAAEITLGQEAQAAQAAAEQSTHQEAQDLTVVLAATTDKA
jgi:hypothetical protein